MKYVELVVNEYYGNEFCFSRKAKYYENRTIEFEPLPVYDDVDDNELEEVELEDGENDDDE
jgi:hypothetical protein